LLPSYTFRPASRGESREEVGGSFVFVATVFPGGVLGFGFGGVFPPVANIGGVLFGGVFVPDDVLVATGSGLLLFDIQYARPPPTATSNTATAMPTPTSMPVLLFWTFF
jgi:hypothetical protein